MRKTTANSDVEYDPQKEETVQVVFSAITVPASVAWGVAWGVVAWSSYALVEYVLCCIVPLLSAERGVFTRLNWTLTAWLFNSYWLLGAVAGGVCGGLLARLLGAASSSAQPARARLAGAISLYAAVILNFFLTMRLDHGMKAMLTADIGLICAAVWVVRRPGSRLVPWLRLPPLVAALFLLLPSWFGNEMDTTPEALLRRVEMILIAAGILVIARLLNRFHNWSPERHLASNLGLLAALIILASAVSGKNRALPPTPAHLAADPGLPPVVLVSFDTTRADHMSVYGYSRKTTPHLEEFARHATLFTDAVAASDWTLPSHASIFTGLYGSWHGAHGYAGDPIEIRPLPDTIPTLPGILRDRGMVTVGVAANKYFLAPEWGLGRGFQSFNVQTPVPILPLDRPYYLRYGIRRLLSCCVDTVGFDQQCRSAEAVNTDAISVIDDKAVGGRSSFFLFVNYMDAHMPYVASVPPGVPLPSGRGAPTFSQFVSITDDVLIRHAEFPEPQRRLAMERYDAGIAAEDAALENLLQWLKRRDLYDRALIIVTADHGEAFGEHRLIGHGVSTYEDQVHVPLFIKFPQQSTPRVVRGLVSHVDILPTVLQVLGIPNPPKVQGISLVNPSDLSNRTVFTESFPAQPWTREKLLLNRTERAVRNGPYKLIVSDRGKHELFDVERDPRELHNLTVLDIPQAAGLESEMREWLAMVPAQAAAKPANKEQMRRLKGLGYVR